MAKTTFIYCKTCKEKTKHWDNTGTEMETKLGKFVCADCKTPYTPKPKSEPTPLQTGSGYPKKDYVKKDYGDGVPKSMYGAWANNLIVALVTKGTIKTIPDAIAQYKVVVEAYGKVLNDGTTTVEKQAKQPSTDLPDGSTEQDFTVEPDTGGELDLSEFNI